jgi:hypothetical protein
MIEAREGLQEGALQWASLNTTDWVASESKLGVSTSKGSPCS